MTDATTQNHPLPSSAPDADIAWLDEVEGEQALAWVRERNELSEQALADSEHFAATEAKIREILDDTRKIAVVRDREGLLYNFWKDAEHERGVWRRTTWESYRSGDPEWDVLLDLDALAQAEGVKWVWHGAAVLRPACERALIALSPGGSDADVTREFDLTTRTFVAGGFSRPEAKGDQQWADEDGQATLLVTDRGEGTMSVSGYPTTVAVWQRGTEMSEAVEVFRCDVQDMGVWVSHSRRPGFVRDELMVSHNFYSHSVGFVEGGFASFENPQDAPIQWIDVPREHEVGLWRDVLLVRTRADWQVGELDLPSGALVAFDLSAFMAGERAGTVLFTPTESAALEDYTATNDLLLLTVLDDVASRLEVHYRVDDVTAAGQEDAAGGVAAAYTEAPAGTSGKLRWEGHRLEVPVGEGERLTLGVSAVNALESNDVWLTATGYLTPTTLGVLRLSARGEVEGYEALASAPAHFDAAGYRAEQHFAVSKDGTRIPYTVLTAPGFTPDGSAPAILAGYGGFEVSYLPGYAAVMGSTWVAEGGVYAVANIRGGGEYGPRWHAAALKEKRHKAYEDFAAVAANLVERGYTSASRLGCWGGSNGGLLMGNMLTQYPDHFGAIVCKVPLLDMRRFHTLLAGASWIAEYGDPDDPAQWEFMRTFSAYHLFDAKQDYPPIFFTTSTKDDRVHPAHARTLAYRMLEAGKDVTYFENIEGGHGGASTNAQAARVQAMEQEFFRSHLGAAQA
ncbi:MAG: prolyl oligopeptidase family serine peptidase [Buchananella hordeovulneris]|nr:prolyl oligopeptidase family serine peptidase [Buchananella hordeovulneris]